LCDSIEEQLARAIHSLVVVILVVAATSEPLDRIDLMVVLVGPLTLEVITVVAAPIPSFPPFSVVVAMRIAIVESPMAVAVVVSSTGVVGLLASSDVLSD